MDDPNQINPPQNTSDNNPQIDSQEYQDILDKYAKEIAKNPPEPQTPPEPNIDSLPSDIELTQVPPTAPIPSSPPPQPEFEFPQPPPQEVTPVTPDLPHELPPPLPPKDDIEPPIEEIPHSKPNPFLKLLFFISLLVFLAVILGLVYVYLIAPAQINQQNLPQTDQNTPTSIPSGVCLLNDQSFNVGQSFPAADGCNTCTCGSDLTISCTEMACDTSTSVIPSDWQTYTNSQYKFSFQYPANSVVLNNNYTGYSATFIIDNISGSNPNYDVTFYIGSKDGSDYDDSTKTSIAGFEAIRVSLPTGHNPPQELVFFSDGKTNYEFQLVWDGKDQTVLNKFNQILSTFKFTK